MRFAYADPPYIGQAKRHYADDPLCAEVDHKELIDRLMSQFPDGWALSASSPSLGTILPLCPAGYRVAAWCKSFCAFKRNVRPAYAWEPVIYYGGRNPMHGHRAVIPEKNGKQTTPKDFHVAPITLQKGLCGAKPESVCRWVLELLNVQEGDEVVDLYPGTGVMGRVAREVTGTGRTNGMADTQTAVKPERRADELPLISVMERTDMDRARQLIMDHLDYAEQATAIAEAQAAGKQELVGLINKYSLPGCRVGEVAVYYGGLKRRRTLDKRKVALYLDAATIEECHTDGKAYEDIRITDLSKTRERGYNGDSDE